MIYVDKSLKSFSGKENRPFQSIFIVQDYTDVFLCFSSIIIALKLGALNKVKIREDRVCLHFLGFVFLKNRNL